MQVRHDFPVPDYQARDWRIFSPAGALRLALLACGGFCRAIDSSSVAALAEARWVHERLPGFLPMPTNDDIRTGWHRVGQIGVVLVMYLGCGALLNITFAKDPSLDDATRGAMCAGGLRLMGFLLATVEKWFK